MNAKKCSQLICVAGALQFCIVVGGITVENKSPAILSCTTALHDYPEWTGPPFVKGRPTIYNYQKLPVFNSALGEDKLRRMTWADNNTDLNFSAVIRTDEGNYSCSDAFERVSTVELMVRVPPSLPTIYNTTIGSQNELTVSGTEGTPLTLTCISVGGYPQQTVKWYRESVTSTPLQPGLPVIVYADLFNITSSHTFTPTSLDDGLTYICQSSYSGEPQLIRSTKVKLFLKLQPSTPKVTVLGTLTESSSSVNILRCSSSGFRPQTVSLSWTLGGESAEPVSNPTVEESTANNTFSVSDTYSRAVGRADNWKTLTCSINHETLRFPQTASVGLIVQFPPDTITLTGEFTTVADGSSKTFTCVSGTSNPDAVITWQRNNVIVTAGTGTPTYTNGSYYGRLTTQRLTIKPTRDDDGDVYSCSARNSASRTTANSQQKTLVLTYHPITNATCTSSPVTEGSRVFLFCTASSKPSSSFTWALGLTQIADSQGPVAINKFNYMITSVNRADYGRFTCTAQNGISPPASSSCNLEVKFPALVTTITGNPAIVANGVNTVRLTCTTGSSNPASSITWYLDGQQDTSDKPVQEGVGQYGGKVSSQVLVFTPSRDMDGLLIKCRAGNGLSGSSFVEDQVALDLKYSPVVNVLSRTETETLPGHLRCLVSSKPPATIKWFRIDYGQTLLLEGTGNNSLDYRMGAVSRDDSGTYMCTANNGIGGDNSSSIQLVVQFPALVTTITGNPAIVANGVNTVRLTCTTGSSNPASSITWYLDGQQDTSDKPVQEGVGQYGGKVSSQVLVFTPSRDMDGLLIKCRAGNGLSGSSFVEDQVALDLKYSPVVNVLSRTETETLPGHLRCLVSSKPPATIKWFRIDYGQTLLLEGTGNNSLDYRMGAVSRDDSGTYMCTANNGIGGDNSSSIQLVVQYKPDVTIIAQNATENTQSELRCEPRGMPNSYTYISWEQTWPGSRTILRTLPGASVLILSDLRYEHTGIYTCRVDNGVNLAETPVQDRDRSYLS
ncbi:hemicentin-2-like [Mya arenaria]|uniref:hemicentin-2-like n=1 Tax=Mya arenaria TaxID=6604 RepID=UPI0022E02BBE|nr:hemicentin-2-like [Mya arenaria]